MSVDSIRRWLRSDMLVWRWVFLGLYAALLGSAVWFVLDRTDSSFFLIWIGVLVAAQTLFIFGGGTVNLCRPIRKRRLIVPVLVASLMFTLLLGGLGLAMLEYFKLEDVFDSDAGAIAFWATLLGSWIAWSLLLLAHTRPLPRFRALSRMSNLLIAGSLAELLAAVPAHVVVSRRPGCLVGLGTMLGIVAGLNVMLFSFGPAIALLFLRPRYRREQMESAEAPLCGTCGYDLRASSHRCPECGTAIPPVPPGCRCHSGRCAPEGDGFGRSDSAVHLGRFAPSDS